MNTQGTSWGTDEEHRLVIAYRTATETQKRAVRAVLEIEKPGDLPNRAQLKGFSLVGRKDR